VRLGTDYHIHTFYQRCGNGTLTLENIIRRAEGLRMTSLAITDHINNFEHIANHKLIKQDIEAVETDLEVFFGCELNFMSCDGPWPYNEQIHQEYGFEVVIGGIHSTYTDSQDIVEVRDIQQRHHMRTLNDPLLNVLVHPYWFGKAEWEARPAEWWVELLETMPDDYVREMAQASAANDCAIEVNACAIFYNKNYPAEFQSAYIRYLGRLRDEGALFTVGSDAHDIKQIGTSEYCEGILDGLGVPAEQIWRPRASA